MVEEALIGKKIQQYRILNRLTLQELADKAGLTKGYLSRIENSKKSPPVSTLLAVVNALHISISELFGESAENATKISLVRPSERVVIAKDASSSGYEYVSLAPKFPNSRMEPYIMTFPPTKTEKLFTHKGEEFVYVLEGKGVLFFGDKEMLLKKGDAVYFDSEVPHHGHAEGKTPWRCLVVIYNEMYNVTA
ncbi:MAG: cupin domain-containing protein [Smithella sp.]